MEITEKVAYLKGLMDGLNIDKTTTEGKVFHAIMDILDDVACSVSDLETGLVIVAEQVDLIDGDLTELQDDLFGDEDCNCGHHHRHDDDDDFEGELYEVTCPSCNDTVCVDEDMLDEGEIICPGCGEQLEFDLDGIIDDDDEE